MDFVEYAKGIDFNTTKPNDPAYKLETENTDLPFEKNDRTLDITELCAIPRMSTYAIGALINKGVRELPDGQCYVNVGVWHGFSFLAGMFGNPDKMCIGIDDFTEFGGPRLEFRKRYLEARGDKHQFYEMDYKQYFQAIHLPSVKIGFYFYDGAHDYKNQLEGLRIAEPFLADNAIIMVDDINWPDPDKATRDFIETSDHDYAVVLDKKTSSNAHPTWWNGIMILQKRGVKSNG